ncbi:hypothetical protein GCM10007989_27240 [Devosia pacifica]|uniref:DUF1499 domain-containing protein n=1 Tax=Devosia pacifica TaxID=1335967 RepID=A0A918S9A0_9HYPH|nr:DUF1499 domain-containing protein [Devosia pacifica]GHA30113.1 hypothetical protein GCM10007989_27240 [Devosia pacifica]
MRILIRTSRSAIWSRRLASLALPLLIIPIILHRSDLIETTTFHTTEILGFLVALSALLLSLLALARLWHTGDQGWGRAVPALLISLICLAPFAWVATQALATPETNDVATANRAFLPLAPQASAVSRNPLSDELREAAFPNATRRDYPLNAQQIYDLLIALIDEQGWDLIIERRPGTADGTGQINARATHLLGWQDQIVLAIRGLPEGARVDMRSASVDRAQDLGANGQRIEQFLGTVDTAVTSLIRDNPNITQPVIESEDDALAPEEATQ